MFQRPLVVMLSALLSTSAAAQSLDDRVRELERRVEQLEKQRNQPGTVERSANSRQLQNWRSLKTGMTETEVRSILGEPHKVDVNPVIVFWYYDFPRGGSVRFDGSSRRLEGWSEPTR